MRSRLSRTAEKQSKKSTILSIIGMIIVIGLLAKFGTAILTNITIFLSGSQNTPTTTHSAADVFVAPPVLNPLPNATNSAQTNVSGKAMAKQTINLYVNDTIVDKTQTAKDNTFEFKEITLSKGENVIKTKAINEQEKESDFSNSSTIVFKSDAPTLTIDSPSDNQTFQKDDSPVTVKGKTDSGVRITINDLRAIVDDSGSFSYNLPLKGGDNIIKIVATDQAGNKTELQRKVTYSQ